MTEVMTRPEPRTASGWPRAGTVRFVEVPERRCLMIDGTGAPGESEFSEAIGALFGTAYTLKFALKARGIAWKVGYLEALWQGIGAAAAVEPVQPGAGVGAPTWTMFMELPDVATEADVAAAIEGAWTRHPSMAMGHLRVERWREGLVVEAMHVGPYAAETPTIERMMAAAEAAGLHPTGAHHEIYIGDPNRSAPEKLRTVLRQPVG